MSGQAFSLTNNLIDVDRNGTLFDPLVAASYVGAGPNSDDNYEVDDYNGKRNGAPPLAPSDDEWNVSPPELDLGALAHGRRLRFRRSTTLSAIASISPVE